MLPLLAALFAVTTFAAVAEAGNATMVCQNLTVATTVLVRNDSRQTYSIWTTSGAVTIYWAESVAAVVPPGAGSSSSGPLTGGTSFTCEKNCTTALISVVPKSGTPWVCARETF